MEHKNEHRVQHHVEDAAEHHAGAGLPGVALAAQQMTQRQADHGGHAAHRHHPQKVALGVGPGVGAGPQKAQQRPPGQPGAQREQQGEGSAAPDAEGRHILDVLVVVDAQHPGDQAAAAQAEQVAQRCQQIEPGRHQGHRRHHGGVPQLPHKKGVGQVVDHGHHLADDGGHRQGGHGLGHRHLLKQIFFLLFLHRIDPSFSQRGKPPARPEGTGRGLAHESYKSSFLLIHSTHRRSCRSPRGSFFCSCPGRCRSCRRWGAADPCRLPAP